MTGSVLADESLPLKSKGKYLGRLFCNVAKQSKKKAEKVILLIFGTGFLGESRNRLIGAGKKNAGNKKKNT